MIFLIISIIFSAGLMMVFKWVERSGQALFPVIVISYIFCAVVGIALNGELPEITSSFNASWFPFALLLGFLFITVFYLVGFSTQTTGVTPTVVAFKLSVVIPVSVAFFLYNDSLNAIKLTGILLALVAIYLSSKQSNASPKNKKGFAVFLPALVFIGSGTVDAIFNYAQKQHLDDISFNTYLIFLFGTSSTLGLIFLVFGTITKRVRFGLKEIIGGIILGIPNYGSVYFMLKALAKSGLESSAIWPVNNIGIIILSTGAAFMIFKEKISVTNLTGIVIAIAAIILIALSS